jgi:hypothetical protein
MLIDGCAVNLLKQQFLALGCNPKAVTTGILHNYHPHAD